jgi:hypothetical protein
LSQPHHFSTTLFYQQFLEDNEFIPADIKPSISEFMAAVHTSVNETSKIFLERERRYNYTTPKSFLEQVRSFPLHTLFYLSVSSLITHPRGVDVLSVASRPCVHDPRHAPSRPETHNYHHFHHHRFPSFDF